MAMAETFRSSSAPNYKLAIKCVMVILLHTFYYLYYNYNGIVPWTPLD